MLRKAHIKDAQKIYVLIRMCAKKGTVLERSLNYIYENIRDFWICEKKQKIIGVAALGVVGWQNLAEIKSLVVASGYRKQGIGTMLVEACLNEARTLGIKQVFALTFIPSFFKKLGFRRISMQRLPHKIWSDCVECISFPNCKEVALMRSLKKHTV